MECLRLFHRVDHRVCVMITHNRKFYLGKQGSFFIHYKTYDMKTNHWRYLMHQHRMHTNVVRLERYVRFL